PCSSTKRLISRPFFIYRFYLCHFCQRKIAKQGACPQNPVLLLLLFYWKYILDFLPLFRCLNKITFKVFTVFAIQFLGINRKVAQGVDFNTDIIAFHFRAWNLETERTIRQHFRRTPEIT